MTKNEIKKRGLVFNEMRVTAEVLLSINSQRSCGFTVRQVRSLYDQACVAVLDGDVSEQEAVEIAVRFMLESAKPSEPAFADSQLDLDLLRSAHKVARGISTSIAESNKRLKNGA